MRCSRDRGMTHRQMTLILFEDMINGEIRTERWRGKNDWRDGNLRRARVAVAGSTSTDRRDHNW
jgi:hypothetical protein